MTLHVTISGQGSALVLLHGWGMSGAVWNDVRKLLAPHFRLHIVDLPGHGESDTQAVSAIGDLAQYVAQCAPRSTAVCGWSLGGQVALAWARLAPAQVTALALIATSPCFVQRADWKHAVSAEVWSDFAQALSEDAEAALRRFVSLQAHGDVRGRAVARCLREALSPRLDIACLRETLAILQRTDLRGQLHAITQPALVLYGEEDAITPPGAAAHLSRQLPNARLAAIRGAAHAPFVSDPNETARQLTAFFAK